MRLTQHKEFTSGRIASGGNLLGPDEMICLIRGEVPEIQTGKGTFLRPAKRVARNARGDARFFVRPDVKEEET